jgi:exopolyphosphatase/guanosine-5'-triphosphate,3'-diphosphate pyrophosphatase
MPHPLLAALDLGSNTFRLILAEEENGAIRAGSRRVYQEIPRLSEGLFPGGALAPEPLERAWAALGRFQELIIEARPEKVLAGATMFARLSPDGPAFLSQISSRFGWESFILSGEEEGRLSALGVLSGLRPLPAQALIFDLGGRSTELALTRGLEVAAIESLPMGVVGLTESFVSGDPPLAEEIGLIRAQVIALLEEARLSGLDPEIPLVGTAGTVTTLAAMLLGLGDYDPDLINNRQIHIGQLRDLLSALARETQEKRLLRPGLHPRRADVIVAGLAEVLAIMDYFGRQTLTVSDNSLLEGLWLKAAGALPPSAAAP